MAEARAEAVGVRVRETPRGLLLEDEESAVFIPWSAVELIIYNKNGDIDTIYTRFSRVEIDHDAGMVKVFPEEIRVSADVIQA